MKHEENLSKLTIKLHWIVAIGIIGLMSIGIYMSGENKVYSLYSIHKSLGVILLIFIIFRVVWRLTKGFPSPIETHKPWERKLATTMLWVLLIGSLAFPVSGIIMSAMSGNGVNIFGLDIIAANIDSVTGKPVAINKGLASFAHSVHGFLGDLFIAVISLYVLGAIKHHVIDKDNTLKRIVGK